MLFRETEEQKMKVAFPVWQSRISPVFDTAEHLVILEVEEGHEVARMEYPIIGLPPAQRAKRLEELEVDSLICGAVSRHLANMLKANGIEVIPWISGAVDDVLPRYLNGLPLDGPFLMPGCNRQNRRQCRRARRHMTKYPEETL
ncbi:MAG: hypothetical protein C4520_08700 [Candidatus Abyssobacteria bacterium SURF_5]|uniref:Dinitrogenase iron-molybdenum cofactor biosynthesis domain-containing protein n=1 Tax=Abyssobacteria bacterium (strain SURF_5) TaxID=2093360 RepID=A0A3A4NNU5_ABYX5|nr:MAG: hypothetical protein C4520_08700 [Candidatus Abyssubacteria bacterium SURF_5]